MFMRFADAEMGGHMSVFGPGLYKNGRHLGPPQFRGKGETAQDRADRQIEYPDEDPWIRATFEAELAKRGAKSLMVPEAYRDRDYQWDYGDD